jgi:hypothetical protein
MSMFNELFEMKGNFTSNNVSDKETEMDRREAYKQRAFENAQQNIGPWLSVTILTDSAKRARNNGWEFDLDRKYLEELWHSQNGLCAVSGVKMQTESGTRSMKNAYRGSLDRIDNSKGYVKGNVRFTTHWVNNAKSTWPDSVFEDFIGNITKIRR